MTEQLPLFDRVMEVPSMTTKGLTYMIDTQAKTCSCPSFRRNRKEGCKHLHQLGLVKPPRRVVVEFDRTNPEEIL